MAYLVQRTYDGLVVNVAEWDGETQFTPFGAIVVNADHHPGVWIGWRWDGAQFVAPEQPDNPLSPAVE